MEEHHQFQLSSEEARYLQTLASRDESFAGLLGRDGARICRVTIQLSYSEAEQLREHLTRRLAEVGFDDSYSPNEEGVMLEELIDRFFGV